MDKTLTHNDVVKTLILTYKGYPCLWKNDVKISTAMVKRNKAYEHLLSIYKQAEPLANLLLLKKKLGNMRTAYKREYKKVLEAKSKGKTYLPLLWYYPYFSFLDSPNHTSTINASLESDEEITIKQESEDEESNEEYVIEEVYPPNEAEISPAYTNVEFLESDEDVKFDIDQETPGTSASQNQTQSKIKDDSQKINSPNSQVEYFGRAIGLQLQELTKLQKSIAEKLISEVIFYGRLSKLNTDSVISLE